MNHKNIELGNGYKETNHTRLEYVIWGIQFFNTFIIPIIITFFLYLFNKNERIHKLTRNVLNFQLTLLLYFTLGVIPLSIIYLLDLHLFFSLILALISIIILFISSIIYFVYPIFGIAYVHKDKTFSFPFILLFI